LEELSCKTNKRLFVIIVALCRNVVILKIFLSMKYDLARLDFSILDINFVSTKDNGNILANADQILVPVRHVFVSLARKLLQCDNLNLVESPALQPAEVQIDQQTIQAYEAELAAAKDTPLPDDDEDDL
jgi:hypothetical protein